MRYSELILVRGMTCAHLHVRGGVVVRVQHGVGARAARAFADTEPSASAGDANDISVCLFLFLFMLCCCICVGVTCHPTVYMRMFCMPYYVLCTLRVCLYSQLP